MDWYRDKSYANQNKVKFPGKDTSDALVDLNHESRFNLQKSRFFGPEKICLMSTCHGMSVQTLATRTSSTARLKRTGSLQKTQASNEMQENVKLATNGFRSGKNHAYINRFKSLSPLNITLPALFYPQRSCKKKLTQINIFRIKMRRI